MAGSWTTWNSSGQNELVFAGDTIPFVRLVKYDCGTAMACSMPIPGAGKADVNKTYDYQLRAVL